MKAFAKIAALAAFVAVAGCEKGFDPSSDDSAEGCKVVFRMDQFEMVPFSQGGTLSRGTAKAEEFCTRINLAVYNADGKVKSVNQAAGDTGFGTAEVTLPPGEYRVAVVAHSGAGNATMTTPEKVTFPSNKVTDTFYFYGGIDVKADAVHDIGLKRAVAMFRMEAKDGVPANVSQMEFKYTGGSSTLDATTGLGCVNSRQTETRAAGSGTFDIYTFPHAAEGKLKITATAKDAAGAALHERVFEDVPVKTGQITLYEGDFFKQAGSSSPSRISFTADTAWTLYRQAY